MSGLLSSRGRRTLRARPGVSLAVLASAVIMTFCSASPKVVAEGRPVAEGPHSPGFVAKASVGVPRHHPGVGEDRGGSIFPQPHRPPFAKRSKPPRAVLRARSQRLATVPATHKTPQADKTHEADKPHKTPATHKTHKGPGTHKSPATHKTLVASAPPTASSAGGAPQAALPMTAGGPRSAPATSAQSVALGSSSPSVSSALPRRAGAGAGASTGPGGGALLYLSATADTRLSAGATGRSTTAPRAARASGAATAPGAARTSSTTGAHRRAKPGRSTSSASRSATSRANGLAAGRLVLAAAPWRGVSLRAATHLSMPIAFGLLVTAFAVVQALIDRRDPKLSKAPARNDDDTVAFE